jgi:hypothetical protein
MVFKLKITRDLKRFEIVLFFSSKFKMIKQFFFLFLIIFIILRLSTYDKKRLRTAVYKTEVFNQTNQTKKTIIIPETKENATFFLVNHTNSNITNISEKNITILNNKNSTNIHALNKFTTLNFTRQKKDL